MTGITKSEEKKLALVNHVLQADMKTEDKTLLIELLMRADKDGYCWPSVQRLAQARSMKHEKNFKGADFYLPGLVTVVKQGRKNAYQLNFKAISELPGFQTNIKHTPPRAGLNTPSPADNTPAVADNDPCMEGANSTKNNTENSSIESTVAPVAHEPVVPPVSSTKNRIDKVKGNENFAWSDLIDFNKGVSNREGTAHKDTPSTEGLKVTVNGRTLTQTGELDW